MTSIIPAEGRILLKKIERKEVLTKAGILLPGNTLQEENMLYGEVISHTPAITGSTYKLPLKKGSRIFYSRYSATLVVDNKGETFYVLSDLDVVAYETANV